MAVTAKSKPSGVKVVPAPGVDADVAVSVFGLDPDADYTDDRNRVIVKRSGTFVPADVAELVKASPLVRVDS